MIPVSCDPVTIPVRSGPARDVERPWATPAVRPAPTLHVREAIQGRQASAARVLAVPLLLALGACEPKASGVQRALTERGFTVVQLHTTAWHSAPCDWGELYVKGFTGKRDGRYYHGVLCAQDAQVHAFRVFARPTGPAPAWDRFGSAR